MIDSLHDPAEISADQTRLDLDFIYSELSQKYWSRNIPRTVLEKAIANSMSFGVYLQSNGAQIGFARVVTDYATFAYLADVFITESYQGKGYAKQLIATIKSDPQLAGLRRWMLITRDAHGLYRHHEFTMLAHPERVMEHANPDIYKP